MPDIKQMLEDMKNAKTEPSEHCAEGDMHYFNFMMHADSTDSYSNYYKCMNCSEIIVQSQPRTGLNAALWAAED